MSNIATITTKISIPAYSATNDAFLIHLNLKATPNTKLSIQTNGNIALALKRSLRRVIEIMTSINNAWKPLHALEYLLEDDETRFLVKDARSAGLSLAIGLLNIHRAIHQKPQVSTFIGTGILRIDGSIEATHKEDIKQTAIKATQHQQLITSNICQHLFELDNLMDTDQP